MTTSTRTFKIWRYSVSHSMLLLRSLASSEYPRNMDLVFSGVRHIDLPAQMKGVAVRLAEPGHKRIDDYAASNGYNVYVVESGGVDHCVVASSFNVYENTKEMFDCGFD